MRTPVALPPAPNKGAVRWICGVVRIRSSHWRNALRKRRRDFVKKLRVHRPELNGTASFALLGEPRRRCTWVHSVSGIATVQVNHFVGDDTKGKRSSRKQSATEPWRRSRQFLELSNPLTVTSAIRTTKQNTKRFARCVVTLKGGDQKKCVPRPRARDIIAAVYSRFSFNGLISRKPDWGW